MKTLLKPVGQVFIVLNLTNTQLSDGELNGCTVLKIDETGVYEVEDVSVNISHLLQEEQ